MAIDKSNFPGYPRFDVDSKTCPQAVKLVAMKRLRLLVSMREDFVDSVPSNAGLGALIDAWYKNHINQIRAASFRDEWDWSNLSLVFDENVMRPVDFDRALKDYLILLARPSLTQKDLFERWGFNQEKLVYNSPMFETYLGHFHEILYKIFVRAFIKIILEDDTNLSREFSDKDGYLSAEKTREIKDYIDSFFAEGEEDRRSKFCLGIAPLLFGEEETPTFVPFNKLPKQLFDKMSSCEGEAYESFYHSLESYVIEHEDLFLADLYKSVGAHQLAGDKGPVKTTLTNKLIKVYYDWLTALSVGFRGNQKTLLADENNFDSYLNRMKNEFSFYSDMTFKQRDSSRAGFSCVNYGSFEQVFARLQESARGITTRENFIVSFDPCDMVTCSLGYQWSSCQSWIDMFDDLPEDYGNGNDYSGMYNRGNFQFMCGNGLIAFVPYEKRDDLPQFLWAKQKRCLIWINNDLDCMRQNNFYPGKPTDQESLAFAKTIREYLQNVLAPFNFSNGTLDWKAATKKVKNTTDLEYTDFDKFRSIETDKSGRYNDPILTVSYLKTVDHVPSLIYAADFPALDTGLFGNSLFRDASTNVCPICGASHAGGGICQHCRSEMIDHNGTLVHPSNLVKIKTAEGDKLYTLEELEEIKDFVVTEDGTHVPFKSAFKVFMPSGIKYYKKLPSFVKECKVCHQYFHPSFMVGDVCIEHINTVLDDGDDTVSLESVLDLFLDSKLSFGCNDTNAMIKLLTILDGKGIKWQSGKNPSEFVPSSNVSRGRFLSVANKFLILSSQSRSTVVHLSKLIMKGGE